MNGDEHTMKGREKYCVWSGDILWTKEEKYYVWKKFFLNRGKNNVNGEEITVNGGENAMEGGRTCWMKGGKTINGGISNVDRGRDTMNGRKITLDGGGRKYLWTKYKFRNGGGNNINGGRNSIKEGEMYMNRGRSIVGRG